jgi:hypothetical protein
MKNKQAASRGYFSALKRETICSSKTSIYFPRNTQPYIPETELFTEWLQYYGGEAIRVLRLAMRLT